MRARAGGRCVTHARSSRFTIHRTREEETAMFGLDCPKRGSTARLERLFRRAAPRVERLEDRLVPSAFTNGDFEGGSQPFSGIPQDSIPVGWQLGPPSNTSLSNLTVTNTV